MSDSDPRRQLRTGGDRGRVDRPPGWADSLFAGRSRADKEAEQDAMLKVMIVLGGVVVAPRASELILGVSLAVEQSLTVDQMAHTFAVYPSLSGSLTEAARRLMRPPTTAADR